MWPHIYISGQSEDQSYIKIHIEDQPYIKINRIPLLTPKQQDILMSPVPFSPLLLSL